MDIITDLTGERVEVCDNGLVRVDGIVSFRRVERNGEAFLQFKDRDKRRAVERGSEYIEIPLKTMYNKLK